MILRLSDSLSRGLVVAAALLAGLWLSFFGIRAAIARAYSEGDTAKELESAVRLEPGNADYWYVLGRYQQYNLEDPDAAKAEESYRKAIAFNPVDTDAWLDLGTAYELDGKTEEAREAYQHAKKSYATSADVSWRYGNFLLREGEQPEAYAELRSAIEADPQRAAAAFSRAYRSNPNIDELLKQLLPQKESVYVDVIWEALSAKQLAVAKIVWAQLVTLHPHLQIRDIDRFVSELLGAGEFTQARQAWDQGVSTMNLPPLYQPKGSVVWDPSFETDINGSTFSWRYPPIAQGVTMDLDKEEKLSGKQSLRLSFDGKHDPNLEAACTLVIVQPLTSYRLSGWVKTKQLTSDQGIGFRLTSADDAGAVPVLNTRQVLGTNLWTLVDQSWTSSSKSHRVQICVTRDASENSEARISGIAWVDDVNLMPAPPEHRKP
jgi:tetratricopeptide (TPR) repeat protein